MGQAIAADINLSNQGDETNSKNVKFDIYLDETDRSVKEKLADINSGDMKLYVSASVQGGGYLNNAQIELVNTNFRLKNNPEVTKFKLDSIQSEKGVAAGLPIVAKKDESYNLSLLDMQSQIKLTGEYIDDKGNVTDINTTKAVKISWTSDELTAEDVELSEQVITNKVYSIDGANKRVVQVLVKSKIKDNKAPVKSSVIEIANPEIGVNPEEVKVAGYTTKATNGKSSVQFADGENTSWEYNAEEGKTYINVANNASEENVVAWSKNGEDRFVVTYIYDEAAVVAPFISNVKNTVNIYGRTKGAIEKTVELKLEELADVGDIAKIENSVVKDIYKGKMYIGEDTNFETRTNVYIPYSKLANKVTVQDLGDKVLAGENEISEGISTYYKTTKINRAEALKALGAEGTIKVYNAEDKTTPIQEIALSEEIEEDYYTISYEGNVNKIAIEMSAAKAEGTIEVINEKAIKTGNKEIVPTITTLKTNTNINVADENSNVIVNSNVEAGARVLEPVTSFDVSLDKTSISALAENTMRITAELTAKDESNKLYKNPTINIELPKEIKEATIENITPVVGNDELTIKSYNIVTNEAGNKVLVINLTGEQTKYSANVASIVIDVKVKTDAFMADKNVELKATSINNGETVEKVKGMRITSKSGLVTKSTIKIGEDVLEKTNQSNININAKGKQEVEVTAQMINNYGDKLTQNTVIGNVPEGGALKSAVTTNMKDAVVYYSEETNPSVDSESWKTEVANLENVKSFKIAGTELAQGTLMTVNYKYALNAEAEEAQTSTIKVNGTVAGMAVEDTLSYVANGAKVEQPQERLGTTTNAEKISVQTVVTAGGEEVANGAEINNGQVLRYKVRVTNTSSETLNNVKLKATIENGVFYDLVEDGGTYYDGELDKMMPGHKYAEVKDINYKEVQIEKLEAGKTSEIEYQVVAYVGEGENANQFTNNIILTADNIDNLSTADTKIIKEGKIALKLHYNSNEEPKLYSNGDIKTFEIELINLTKTDMKNVPIKIALPNELYCDVEDQMYIDENETSINVVNNELMINVHDLKDSEAKKIYVQLKTQSIPLDKLEVGTVLFAKTDYEGTNYISNDYIRNIHQAETNLDAEFKSDKDNKVLHVGDEITYTLTLVNNGMLNTGILYIYDKMPDGLNVKSILATKNSGENVEYKANSDGNLEIEDLEIGVGEKLTIKVVATLDSIVGDTNEITNTIEISGSTIDTIEKSLTNKINDINNPTDPENPSENPDDNKDRTKSISGLAWLDENKDGIKDADEKVLQAVKVVLLDKEGKQVAETTTSLAGTYKFADLQQGEYTVVFEYDTSKYAVTKYQVSGAKEDTNSDAISKQIEISGETKAVGATDTIKLEDKDIANVDIGLIENAKFDLSLNKYISKVILTNKAGTTTYEYENTNLAKVEISARRIAGTVMLVEYDLQITNEGDVDGYVEDVIDYLPDGLVFTSETNKDWYMDGNKVLHNKSIADQVIKPGETKTVTLVLTKTLKADSTGTIENIGEIGSSRNLLGIAEHDSIAGNKKAGEDDMSTASLIVSIATGSPIMYIGIVVATMIVLGLGIYIINKKVLKVRI